jgi:peptide-methionine (R)-S-oxide reductase
MPPDEPIDMNIFKSPVEPVGAALSRRSFLSSCSLAAAGLALGCSRSSQAAVTPGKVTLVEFSDAGKRLRTVTVDRLIKSDAAWRQQLSPLSYQVARHAATERAFTGSLLTEHGKGVFRCLCCDTALFDSATKFESGTGWPSFWQPIAKQNVIEDSDRTLGMVRTEVRCTRCEAHLGHVFDDGPKPTGLRYCMNSASLRFAAA